ncbi:MAG TPA: hypothetical protein VG795_00075 [Acidimicrobiia bacterium]|nr:hypothetical protein [Acidimicrobiia bacterium]
MTHIRQVVLGALRDQAMGVGSDLPETGAARAHGEPSLDELHAELLVHGGHFGPRADQAHATHQNEQELGQLVEVVASHPLAEGRRRGGAELVLGGVGGRLDGQ